MELEAVGDLALHSILTKLGPKDSALAACVCRKLRSSASEDSLWEKFCNQDLDLFDPIDHLGNPIPSFKETYLVWRQAFGMYPWPLVKRVKKCWDKLKNWLTLNFPEALVTLRKGASEADIQLLENSLKVKLPFSTRILYRFHDGQELKGKYDDRIEGCPLGIIGGYSFYNRSVNVYLLPLTRVISETKEIIRDLGFSRRSKYIVVASSSTLCEKIFFLNCVSGQLHVGTAKLRDYGEMMPCVPNALMNSVHEYGIEQDAMLQWLEEHGRRLENGTIKIRENNGIKSISLFADEPPLCSIAITNGVRVRASAVFIPELSNLEDNGGNYLFSYSIRMSLQTEGCIINGMKFSSCQLHLRHWTIRANDNVVSKVDAEEAVIGKFPLLHPGEEEFVYESCSPLPSSVGSIEGSFTFVPGSLRSPKGSPFEVQVARFPLQVPDFIF